MEKWTQFNRVRLWHVAFFCAALFAAGMFIPTLTTAQSSSKEDTYRQLGLSVTLPARARNYVDDIDDRELIEAAITSMLTSLDPHSSFLNTENFSKQEHTKFVSVALVSRSRWNRAW